MSKETKNTAKQLTTADFDVLKAKSGTIVAASAGQNDDGTWRLYCKVKGLSVEIPLSAKLVARQLKPMLFGQYFTEAMIPALVDSVITWEDYTVLVAGEKYAKHDGGSFIAEEADNGKLTLAGKEFTPNYELAQDRILSVLTIAKKLVDLGLTSSASQVLHNPDAVVLQLNPLSSTDSSEEMTEDEIEAVNDAIIVSTQETEAGAGDDKVGAKAPAATSKK